MYVDTESDNPDDFSKAVLETLKEEENIILKVKNPGNNEDRNI
jgi:hypothetical protein